MNTLGFPGDSVVKNPLANAGDAGSIPGSGKSPGEGNGNPLQILAWEIPWTENLVGCSPWACKELDMTQQLNNKSHFHHITRIVFFTFKIGK